MSKDEAYIRKRDLTDTELDALERAVKNKGKLHDGVYELSEAGLLPMTQAIKEDKDSVTMRVLGEVREAKVRPILEACANCDFWQGKFPNTEKCQERQGRDANARGFSIVICSHQFIEGEK